MKIGTLEIVTMQKAVKAGWPGGWHWLPYTYTRIWQQESVCRWLWFAWGFNDKRRER